MRILLISREIYPHRIGGKEVFLYHLAKELQKRKHQTRILCEKANGSNDKNLDYIEQKLLSIPRLRLLSFLFKSITAVKKIASKVEIINAHFHDINCVLLPILKWLYGIPYIITVHGGGLRKWQLKPLFRLAYLNAACVITVSDGIKDEYVNRGCKDVLTIPPMLPFQRHFMRKQELFSKYGLDPESKILLFLGRLIHAKRPDFLLKVFISLGEEYIKSNKINLIFVGDGPLRSFLQETVQGSGLNRSIKFLGYVPHHQVGELFRLADLFVLPSDYEGFPLSVIEAMHYGLTVIGSDTRGINEIITHNENGILFPKGDKTSLRKCLTEILEDEKKRKKIGNSAKRHVKENYSFDKIVDRYIAVYKDVISGSRDQHIYNLEALKI